MAEQLSRKKLYDLVWSEPMRNLSTRFGISDVALKKTCARAGIPTPDRGYWAKKEAGKETIQSVLPMRPPGMNDESQSRVEVMVRTNTGTRRRFLASLAILHNLPSRSNQRRHASLKSLDVWLSRIRSGRGTPLSIVSSKRMINAERSN